MRNRIRFEIEVAGNVDSAVFGSLRMVDEKTVVMDLGENRTLANLRQNSHDVYLIVEPGKVSWLPAGYRQIRRGYHNTGTGVT